MEEKGNELKIQPQSRKESFKILAYFLMAKYIYMHKYACI